MQMDEVKGLNDALLFVGSFFPEDEVFVIEKNSLGVISYAADQLQKKLILGLNSTFNGTVSVLTEPSIGGFPRNFKKYKMSLHKFKYLDVLDGIQYPFFNLSGFNILSKIHAYKKGIDVWERNTRNKNRILVFYALSLSNLVLIKWVKKNFPSIHVHIIIPDLVQFTSMTNDRKILHRILKKFQISLCNKNIKLFDTYTLLTKYMAEKLNIEDGRYVVIEGIADVNNYEHPLGNTSNRKMILYTGTLTRKYGVMNLVNAFQMINNQEYELVICGGGETAQEIIEAANKDERIKFLGQVSHSEVLELQKRACLLVNPRKNDEEFTRYSFPSKMMEYLASGKPVLCYKLDGFPDEYDDYFYYVNGDTIEDLSRAIVYVCEKSESELEAQGKRNQSFVRNKKNPFVQTKKIVDIIKS